jgi:multidrug resistance efflux pump
MKKIITLTISSILLMGVLSACSSQTPTASAATPAPDNNVLLIAEGKLQPVKSLDESFTVPGEIGDVLVKDGDKVTAGQNLVSLSNTAAARLALAQAQQEALDAKQALDDLTNSTLSAANAQLALAQAQDAYNTAYSNYLNGSTTQGSANQIASTQAQLIIMDDKISDLEEKLYNQAELADSDPKKAETVRDLAQARIDREKLQKILNYYKSPASSTDQATLAAELAVAKSKLADAQRVFDRIKDGVDPNELAAAQARVTTANAAVVSAQAALDSLQLTSGIAGTVVDINVIPGQQVAAGEAILSVADYSNWVVLTDNLTEADVVNVKEGQKVQVTLDALPGVTLSGTVTHINSRYQEVRGDVTYTVTITLDETDPAMRWGMTAAVKFLK